MEKRNPTSWTFSALGSPKAKLLLLGTDSAAHAEAITQARSFSIEHVSPDLLVQQEISRRTPHGQQASAAIRHGRSVPDEVLLAIARKWFWARKPDAGFLLTGFPATLLQAKVFDEWLEARSEQLTAVFPTAAHGADDVVTHYRTQGLLNGALPVAA